MAAKPGSGALIAQRTGLSLTALSLLFTLIACSAQREEEERPPGTAPLLAEAPPRSDQPDRHWELERLKRLPDPALELDTVELYSRARRRLDAMPRVSPGLRGPLPHSDNDAWERANVTSWQALGPGNIGGRTRTLVIDPQRPQIMYSGGVSGGVWKSTNAGASWAPTGDDLANLAVNSLVLQPDNPRVLYAGTGEGYFREAERGTALPLRGGGIFKSTDSAKSWTRLETTANEDFHWVNDLVISPHSSRRLYAATRSGVWRSSDRGESWRRILATSVQGGCLELAIRSDTGTDTLFASCGSFEQATVWRTDDAGSATAWQAVLSDSGQGRTSLAIAPSSQNVVYAMAASNSKDPLLRQGLHAVFRSDDGGNSWRTLVTNQDAEPLHRLLLTNAVVARLVECGFDDTNQWITMGWYVNVLAVDPLDPERVFAAGVDLFRSDDGGQSWAPASFWWDRDFPAWTHADQHAVVFHPNYDGDTNRTFFLANDGGLFRGADARASLTLGSQALCDPSLSGMTFSSLANGLGITQFYDGAVFPDGRAFFGGTQDNGTVLGTLAAGTDAWQRIYGGDGAYVAVDPDSPNVLYLETQWANLQKSVDGGANFEPAQQGLADSGFLFITPFVLDPNDGSTLWIGGHRIWRTRNGAASWQAASTPLGGGDQVSALAVARGDSQRVVVGTREGFIYRSRRALDQTTGSTWAATRPRSGFVTSLAIDPTDRDVIYAAYARFGGKHVWRSRDGGASFESIDGSGSTGLPDIPVHSIVVDPDHAQRLFLGTDLGLFVSIDGGGSWAVENTGFANVVTEDLELAPDKNGRKSLYAFTHGRGAWRSLLLDPTDAPQEPPEAPESCEPTEPRLCLRDGRFSVEASFSHPDGSAGTASVQPLTTDTGALWFFREDNLELLVKILDGTPLNGHFWVFYGALSTVEYELTVTDHDTARVKRYRNPKGRLASSADTEAFPLEGSRSGVHREPLDLRGANDGICVDDAAVPQPNTLCLGRGRFRVEVTWRDARGSGDTGIGHPVALTDDTGVFWFFNDRNLELMLKVLDGRGVNGHFWVFYGALSNVEYEITVTDTETGAVRSYANEAGELRSRADTEAFSASD